MKTTNRFPRTFGSAGSSAGYFMFAVGVFATFYHPLGLVFVAFGGFMGFTNSSTTLDIKNKKVRFTNNVFGFIKYGKWIDVEQNMTVGIKYETMVEATYSRSNRAIVQKERTRIMYLFDKNNRQVVPILKLKKGKTGEEEIDFICKAFEIKRIKQELMYPRRRSRRRRL